MQGSGNDFIVLNQLNDNYNLSPDTIKILANRHYGIGFDQLLIIENTTNKQADFKYRIINADGSEVEQCGNGARCFFQYIKHYGLSNKDLIIAETKTGLIELQHNGPNQISVDMGRPIFNRSDIPFFPKNEEDYFFRVKNQKIKTNALSMGNPHAVFCLENLQALTVQEIKESAKAIQRSPLFPKSVNVGFMEIINKNKIRLKVYERGSGQTKACGSGACAAAVISIQNNWVSSPVSVEMDGGILTIEWDNKGHVILSGPAQIVFEGEFDLESIHQDDKL
jgi:diaminopimelate epimerase